MCTIFKLELNRLYMILEYYALDISVCKSVIDVLKTETPYRPSNSINVLLDNPATSAA